MAANFGTCLSLNGVIVGVVSVSDCFLEEEEEGGDVWALLSTAPCR